MKNKHNRYGDFKLSFIDLLLGTLGALIVLFMISLALMQPPKKNQEGIRKDAEYVIIMDWTPEVDCDVDLWVRNPQGIVVSYLTRDRDAMNLERDDRGEMNDTVMIAGKPVIVKRNQEIVTLRAIMQGQYVFNALLYGCYINGKDLAVGTPITMPVKITITKLNPYYQDVYTGEVILDKIYDEKTFVVLNMNQNGFVTEFDTNFFVKLAERKKTE